MRARDFSKVKWTYKKLQDLKSQELDTLHHLYMLKSLIVVFPENKMFSTIIDFVKDKKFLNDKQKEVIKKVYIEYQEAVVFLRLYEKGVVTPQPSSLPNKPKEDKFFSSEELQILM